MKAEKGKQVTVDYEGKLEDGTIFDSSNHGDHSHPLVFVIGEKKVIPGFEKALEGMAEGEEKEFTIKSDDAYGPYREELKQKIPRENLPKEQEPKPGMMLIMNTPDGKQFPVKIAEVDDKEITIDLNSPLAGKDLTFKIKVVKIEDAPEQSSVESTKDELIEDAPKQDIDKPAEKLEDKKKD